MNSHLPTRRELNLLPIALVFEASLGIAGIFFGWLLSLPRENLFAERHHNLLAVFQSLGVGLLATLPMIAMLLLIYFKPIGPLQKLSDDVKNQVAPLFQGLSIPALALISLLAGVGEELLCRWCIQGTLQIWIAGPQGWLSALLIASAIFGAFHWLNVHYAIYACFAGLYLGTLWIWTGDLVVPITVHAVYDFSALLLLKFHATDVSNSADANPTKAESENLN